MRGAPVTSSRITSSRAPPSAGAVANAAAVAPSAAPPSSPPPSPLPPVGPPPPLPPAVERHTLQRRQAPTDSHQRGPLPSRRTAAEPRPTTLLLLPTLLLPVLLLGDASSLLLLRRACVLARAPARRSGTAGSLAVCSSVALCKQVGQGLACNMSNQGAGPQATPAGERPGGVAAAGGGGGRGAARVPTDPHPLRAPLECCGASFGCSDRRCSCVGGCPAAA